MQRRVALGCALLSLGALTLPSKAAHVNSNSGVRTLDLKTKTVKLNSGYTMPVYGLGCYSLHGQTCIDSISTALKLGVRLFDTASIYGNEEEVGKAIRSCGIDRKEIFVTTKLYPPQYDSAQTAIDESLQKLNLGYVDLMLLHHPAHNDVSAYWAMQKAVVQGKIRSIGLSNWYIKELSDFLPKVQITPALVQNEIHPYYQDPEVVPFIQEKGIVVQGWYPLGGRGYNKELLAEPVLAEIARIHNKSLVQVILRWNLQRNIVVIPGSSKPEHIRENTEIFDFALTPQEMSMIEKLNRNEKHDWY